jgi:hypothetical protein
MEKSISNIASEHISKIAKFEDDLRERIIQALKSHGGEFTLSDDTDDDEYFAITYYGGNHPEYASNACSRLEGIRLLVGETDFIVLLEDGEQLGSECDIYGLSTICNFIDAVIEEEKN